MNIKSIKNIPIEVAHTAFNANVIDRYIYFDVPFVVMVKDGFKGLIREDGKRICQIIDNAEPYIVPTKTEIGDIKLFFLKRTNLGMNNINLNLNNFDLSDLNKQLIDERSKRLLNHELFGNLSKNISYSTVLVRFPEEAYKIQLFENESNQTWVREAIIEALNKFLIKYKYLFGRFYIPKVTTSNINAFHMMESFDNGKSLESTFHVYYGSPISFEDTSEENNDNILRSDLRNEEGLKFYDRMKLEVLHKIFLEDFRMAVIESAIWLESWIIPFLKEIYKKRGNGKDKIERIFSQTVKDFETNSDKRVNIFISDVLKTLVHQTIKFPFQDTDEYKAVKKTLKLRNELAHGEEVEVTREQAINAVQSVIDTIEVININYKGD